MGNKRKVTFEFDDSQTDALDNMTDWASVRLRPCDRCGYDWNSGSLWLYHDASTEPSVRCDCGHEVHADTVIEAIKRWNTRISFDWMCTIAMCQKWKNEHERAAILSTQNDCRQRENRELTRLLTSATLCLNALCDGDGINDDTRRLARKLNQWLSEAMPF